jgi:hypothetical protein
MKKKTKKSTKRKQKIDVVLESLLNLERVVKELVSQTEQLRYSQSRFKDVEIDPNKYWPNLPPNASKPYWYNHNSDIGWDSWDTMDNKNEKTS